MGMIRVLCTLGVLVAFGAVQPARGVDNVTEDEHSREKRSPGRGFFKTNLAAGVYGHWGLDFHRPTYGVFLSPVYATPPPPPVVVVDSGPPPNDLYENVLFKLQMSTLLRNNLVNVFGFILYYPTRVLDVDLYFALMDIYQGLRSKRVHCLEMIFAIPGMTVKNPHRQLVDIFLVLRKTKPLYLTGAVDLWLDALTRNQVNVDAMVRPNNGPLQVDLLAGIEYVFLPYISSGTRHSPRAVAQAPPQVARLQGKWVAEVFGALVEGSLPLTPQLVAQVMLHTAIYMFIPEVDEAVHYLADVMMSPRADQLGFAVRDVDRVSRGDPYLLVKLVLARVAAHLGVDPAVRECAQIVLPHFQPLNVASVNPHYHSMAAIFGRRDVNVEVLFSSVCAGEYPDDIVKAKEMLVNAIALYEVNLGDVLRGFVKHDYVSPLDLMFAVLERIKRRATLPAYLRDPLRALTVHVALKYAALNHVGRPFKTADDFYALLPAFYTPQMRPDIKALVGDLVVSLNKVRVDWPDVFARVNARENTRPRQFVRQVLLYLVSVNLVQEPATVKQITHFVTVTDTAGDPKDCPQVKCEGDHVLEPPTTRLPPPITVAPTTPEPPPERKNASDIDYSQLFNSIQVAAADVPDILALENYIKTTIGPYKISLDVGKYPTSGKFLGALFDAYLSRQEVRADPKMSALFNRYRGKIQASGLGARPVTYVSKKVVRLIDMNKVLLALDEDAATKQGQGAQLEVLYTFLAGDYQLVNYLDTFQYESYTTRAEFLAAIFEHLVKFPGNPSDEVKATLRALKPFVRKDGPGAHPLDYNETVHTEVQTSDI